MPASDYVKLEQRLVLAAWACHQLGYSSNKAMLENLREVEEDLTSSGRSHLVHPGIAPQGSLAARSGFVQHPPGRARGSQPDPPYCDDNALAAPQFEFITIENGLVNTRKMSVNHARCREKLSDARRLVPIRQ